MNSKPANFNGRVIASPVALGQFPENGRALGVPGEIRFQDYFAVIRKRKSLAATVFLLVVSVAAVYTFTRTPVYRSEATIEVGQESKDSIKTLGENISQTLGGTSQLESYATESEILKSRSIVTALIARMKLDQSSEFADPLENELLDSLANFADHYFGKALWRSPAALAHADKKHQLTDAVLKRISAVRQGQSRILRVGFEAKDPFLAKEMLQSCIDIYVDRNLRQRQKTVREAGVWLKGELEKTEEKLVSSLTALIKFTSEHGMVSLDDSSNHVLTFFNKAAERLAKSQEQRVQIEAALGEARRAPLVMLPSGVQPVDMHRLHEKLALLESQYSEMQEIYSQDYPKMALMRNQIAALRDRVAELEKNMVSAALDAAKKQELLDKRVFEQTKKEAMDANSLGVEYAVLKKEVETNEQIYKILLQKSKEVDLNAEIVGSNLTVLDPPQLPVKPVRPKKTLFMLVGSLLGLILGATVAFFREHMDNKIRTAEDVEKKLNLPSLGLVPDIKKLNIKLSVNGNGRRYEFLPYYAPNSRASDSIGNVATSIFLSAPLDTMSTLVVSSSVPGEGKTYLAVSISTAMSSGDRKVLVIDTDLRKPAIAKVFGERDGVVGLTSLLSRNDLQLSDVVRSSPVPGLYYLPAGPRPSNPAGVLRSRRMVDLVNHLKTKFNLLVFDTPPIVGFPDVPILSEYCDALILISKEGHVPVQLIRHAADSVSMGRCHLLGVVLNMADVALSHYGGYRYSDYYKYYHYDKYYSTDRLRPRSTERTSRRPHGKGGPPAESA